MDYRVLSALDSEPFLSQRAMATLLGVSLGKVNYCIKALIASGLVKAGNFRQSPNKKAYVYLLTPKGISSKATLARLFLEKKIQEYERLETEIEVLREEVRIGDA